MYNYIAIIHDYFNAEYLFIVQYVSSVFEDSGILTTNVQLASGVGTLTEDLIVNISTTSRSAIGK